MKLRGAAEAPRRAPVRAVLFDMDDTLFDHTATMALALSRLQHREAPLRAVRFPSLLERYRRYLDEIQPGRPGGPPTHDEARLERFRRIATWVGVDDPESDALRWSSRYRRAYQRARRPVPGAPELLRRLHETARVGVVTNNHTREQLGKIRAIGIGRWLDALVTSEETGLEKPDPGIFRVALDRLGASPERAVMVGDSWPTDIVGAMRAGLPAVWLRRTATARGGGGGVRTIRSLEPTEEVARLILRRTGAPKRRRTE
ncbi:MAG TPA: HAD-IA family hydrolase [Thermoplasmata archaeon]|nr:HAD-IA family hydrolase [Thermoplasmata archaeon]